MRLFPILEPIINKSKRKTYVDPFEFYESTFFTCVRNQINYTSMYINAKSNTIYYPQGIILKKFMYKSLDEDYIYKVKFNDEAITYWYIGHVVNKINTLLKKHG